MVASVGLSSQLNTDFLFNSNVDATFRYHGPCPSGINPTWVITSSTCYNKQQWQLKNCKLLSSSLTSHRGCTVSNFCVHAHIYTPHTDTIKTVGGAGEPSFAIPTD